MMPKRRLLDLIHLARPLFLVGGFVFHGLGVAMALYQGASLHLPTLLWGQLAITAGQLMTHYSNDTFDLTADKVNLTPTRWSGGSRVLVEGRLSARVALGAAVVCALLALTAVFILALCLPTGPLTLPLFLLALFLAWEYSAPPLRLHSRGLGAVTVAIIVPILTPLLGTYLQVGRLGWLPLLATWPLACLQAAMIFIINFPDAAADAQVGKRTLVVRLGGQQAARVYLGLLVLAYGWLPLLVVLGLPAAVAGAVCLPMPLALWLAWHMAQGAWREPTAWDRLGFWSVALLMGTAVAETAVFLGLAAA